ncbi:MAG TPA: nickel pincer cofactor biosynthesis protein LarC [Bacillota bacterium]|nr:nickel pincer cofactor biosynthesis protein LarC [Bacillota bacterium]
MKVLYYDCFCGISGDMNLGALVDLGVDGEYLVQELSKLQLDSEYQIKIQKTQKMGITGTKVDVILNTEAHEHHEHHEHREHLGHSEMEPQTGGHPTHDHHLHLQAEHQHTHHHHHHHRNLQDIEKIINDSDLSDRVKKLSRDMFLTIARAEAKVHGKSVDEIHFHEVGAVDSIVDMVGAAVALDYLKVDKIMASPVQVGGGFVKCAHGLFPVPAPATVEILTGIPMKAGLVPFETTTPTGAAILAANVDQFTDRLEFAVEKIGYGIGNRDLEVPNVLRVYLGQLKTGEAIEEQWILETNIDDMNPEFYGYVEEQLFGAGALDVFKTPIIMKKGRPAVKLSILIDPTNEREILEVIFRETTSLGVRKYRVEKTMLQREFKQVGTQYGAITVKTAYYEGEMVKYKAEYEDCYRAAQQHRVPIAKVYQAVDQTMERK